MGMTRNERPHHHPANGKVYASIFEFAKAAEDGDEWEEEEYSYSRSELLKRKATRDER